MRAIAGIEGSAVSSVARLWSPRNKHRLSRHWISFENRIVISGEGPAQAGTLSVQPTGQGGLRKIG